MSMFQCKPDFSHRGVLRFHSNIFVVVVVSYQWDKLIEEIQSVFLDSIMGGLLFPNSFLAVLFALNPYLLIASFIVSVLGYCAFQLHYHKRSVSVSGKVSGIMYEY